MKNGESTGLTEDIFQFVDKPYNLRINSILLRKRNKKLFLRKRKIFLPKIWEVIPQSLKDEIE